jgi:hypothetical protein
MERSFSNGQAADVRYTSDYDLFLKEKPAEESKKQE